MFGANTYAIRLTRPGDAAVLARLAALDDAEPITEPALIGEIAGRPAAALSLVDDRIVADPFERTAYLGAHLRLRAAGIRAAQETPSLAERLRAIFRRLLPAPAASGS